MRFGEHAHAEAEGDQAAPRLRGELGAELGQFGLHLDAGEKQKQLALEATQAEGLGKNIHGRWGIHRIGRPVGDQCLRGLMAQTTAQQDEFAHQSRLILLGPRSLRPRCDVSLMRLSQCS